MKNLVLVLLLFLFANNVFAQNRIISGKILSGNGQALEGVMVELKGSAISTTSDVNGFYSIEVPTNGATLLFIYPGLMVKEVTLDSNTTEYNIELSADTGELYDMTLEQLLNITVTTASKKAEKITDIPASVVILTRKDIELYGFANLEEIFTHITGLYYVNNESFLGPTVGVRGYMTANPTNIVVLINGVPQQNDLHNSFSFHISPIPAEAIDRIEIVRGPMSVIYGSNAFFGAINIITNESLENDETESVVMLGGGSHETKNAMFASKGKSQDFEYSLNFSYNADAGIDKPFSEMVSNFNTKMVAWGISDPNLTSKGYFTNDQKYINLSGKYKDVYVESGFAMAKFGQTFGSLFYLPAQSKSSFSKSAIGWKHEFSDKLSLNTKVSFSRYDLIMEDNYFSVDPNGFGLESDIYSFGQYWSEKVEAEVNIFYTPIENFNLNATAYQASILDVGDKTDAPYNNSAGLLNRAGGVVEGQEVNISAFYAQADYTFANKFTLVAGGRLERMGEFDLVLYRAMYYPQHTKFTGSFTDNDFKFVPRAAFIARLHKNHVIKLMYGEAIKMPAVWELRNNLVVNQSLKPERIKTLEVNYMAQFGDFLNTNLSVYKNFVNDVVLRSIIFNGTNYLSYFANGAEIQTTGAELSITAMPFKGFKAEVSGAYQNSSYHSLGMEDVAVEFSPELLLYLKASYQITSHFSAAITGNYVDAMEAQWDNQPKNPPVDMTPKGRIYGSAVSSYFVLNANLRYSDISFGNMPKDKGFFVALKADNMLDTEIHYPSTSVSAWADKGVLGFGRAFIVTAGFEF